MTRSHTLIVNADDLGLCPDVDAGILDTMRAGTVTSAALLVNPPFTADLTPFLNDGFELGLHLNLSLGFPVTPAEHIRSLVVSDGSFRPFRSAPFHPGCRTNEGPKRSRSNTPSDPLGEPAESAMEWRTEELARELEAQLTRFRQRTGHDPAQVSFHKHLHARHAGLFDLVLRLCARNGLPLRTLDEGMRRHCREEGIPTTDSFLGDVCPGGYWTTERLSSTLDALPEGITELMCHPGHPMPTLPGIWYGPERDIERQTFLRPEVRSRLADLPLLPFDRVWPRADQSPTP